MAHFMWQAPSNDLKTPSMAELTDLKNQSREGADFHRILQREFARRTKANPRYSLRAFAKSLGVYHATLSAIMAGRRPLTAKSIERIGTALGLTPSERSTFIVKSGKTISASRKTLLRMADEEFDLIASWKHDAILEYLQLPKTSENAHGVRKIASRLKLSPGEVMTSLQLLERAGQIVRIENGTWRPVARNTSTILDPNQTSVARRLHQKELLVKSAEALDEISIEERDHSSMTMTVDTEDLPEIKEVIKSFRRKMMTFAQRQSANANQVYCLQISLFPLSNNMEEEQ